MRRPLVAGNWKMHGTRERACALARAVAEGAASSEGTVDVAVCPPHVYLDPVGQCLRESPVVLGAQDLAREEPGAYTGETAGEMLVDLGCTLVLVGHSERRAYYGERDDVVAAKAARALHAGLTPVVCVGESLEERESGVTERVIERQLDAVLAELGPRGVDASVVAYEPVWAIGTGKTATPEQANEVHALIRARVAAHNESMAAQLRIVYGGSVKPGNAEALFAMSDIDGGLIGGASLKAEEFLAICRAAA